MPDLHHEVRRDRREKLFAAGSQRQRDAVRAVCVDDARGRRVVLRRGRIDRSVQRDCLARAIAANLLAIRIQSRQTRRLEKSEARIGRRDQISVAIVKTHANVAGRAVNVAA